MRGISEKKHRRMGRGSLVIIRSPRMQKKAEDMGDNFPHPLDSLAKQQEMKSAQERRAKLAQAVEEDNQALRKSSETLHNNIALISGGTITLSLTYLGSLQSSTVQISHLWLLLTSWVCLIITVPASLFVTFAYSYYHSFARLAHFEEAAQNQKLAEADAVAVVTVVGMSEAEKPGEIQRLKDAAAMHEKQAKRGFKWANFYYGLWRTLGFGSRLLFVIGLALLMLFAMLNTVQRNNAPQKEPTSFVPH
jgi:hypothetical protein